MKDVKVCISFLKMPELFDGDLKKCIQAICLADELGVDQVTITDHVVMGENLEPYPYGKFTLPLDFPWYEPISVLSAIAAVTDRIRLSTGILISPLRPAVLLAKQLATLDFLSGGRVDIGVGTGWQKEEYEATGIAFDERYVRMDEQIRACRELWSRAPASFQGKTVKFENLHAFPRPVQGAELPIWFGVAPTPRNCRRIAELGIGWAPITSDPEEINIGVKAIKAAMVEVGRDPGTLEVRAHLPTKGGPNGLDWDATVEGLQETIDAGVTMIQMMPVAWCSKSSELPSFFERLAKLKSR